MDVFHDLLLAKGDIMTMVLMIIMTYGMRRMIQLVTIRIMALMMIILLSITIIKRMMNIMTAKGYYHI